MVRPPLSAVVLAILLPVLVLGLAGAAVVRPPEAHGFAEAFDKRLAQRPPEVLVLGSSLAHRGIDLGVFARELDVPRDRVELLQLPHASAAHWYAILKNRVYAEGHRPKLVVVAGALTTMLNHDLLAVDANVDRLVEQLGPDEPVIAERVFGFDDPARFRALFVREAAARWRQQVLDGLRDRLLAATFTTRPRLDEATRLAERVNETVFANARMDYALHRASGTGVGLVPLEPVAARAFDLRRHGLLGEMDALADAHGSRLVWVRMPFPPSNRDVDEVPPEIEADALAWLAELGSGWLDLRSMNLSDDDFEDMRHLSKRGAVTFSIGLARALRELASGDGPSVVRGIDVAGPPTRVGTPDPLPALEGAGCGREARVPALRGFDAEGLASLPAGVGLPFEVLADGVALPPGGAEGCEGSWRIDGDRLRVAAPADADVVVAWRPVEVLAPDGAPLVWIVPGTAVRYDVATGWSLPPRSFALLARGRQLAADVPAPVLRANGAQTDLDGDAGRLASLFVPPVPEGAWAAEVAVPEGGVPLLLHHLAVGAPPTTAALLGRTETLYGASVRVVGGRLDDTRGAVTYASPPSVAPMVLKPRTAAREMAGVSLPALAELADAAEKDASRPSACSPLRVLEDGVPLPLPHELCYDVLTKQGGRACHAGPTLYFASRAGGPPASNGRRYTLALDPDRSCATLVRSGATTLRGSWWLYPGDEATFDAPAERLGVFRDGAGWLVLSVLSRVAPATRPLQVEVLQDGEVVAGTTWTPPGAGEEGTLRLPLVPPTRARPEALSVRLRTEDPPTSPLDPLTARAEGGVLPPPALPGEDPGGEVTRSRAPASVSRRGEPPALPVRPTPSRLPDGAWEALVEAAAPVGTPALERAGLGPWSPLRVRADGEALQPVSSRKVFRGGCVGCFLHVGPTIAHRAPGGAAARLEATLDPDLPMRTGDGEAVWWVYPGQELVVEVEGPWRGRELTVRAEIAAFHASRERAGEGAMLRVGDREAPFAAGATGGPGVATLTVPAARNLVMGVREGSGSFLLVRALDVADADGPVRVLRSGAER